MDFYCIKLKEHDLYIGKENSSYALKPDSEVKEWLNGRNVTVNDALQTDAHWFVKQSRAKVWTNLTSLKRFVSYCSGERKKQFSFYVLIHNGKEIGWDILK